MQPLRQNVRYGRVGGVDAFAATSDYDSDPDVDDGSGLSQALEGEPPAVRWLIKASIRSIPVLATLSWLGTLLTLLGLWTFRDHHARYLDSDGSVVSIASIGAAHPLVFLFGSIATAIFYSMSLFTERGLRCLRVLTEANEERHLWVAVGCADVLVGTLAGVSLVLLAVYNSAEYSHEYDQLLICFFVCVFVSGLLQTTEVEHLWHEHPDRDDLREGAFLKWAFLGTSTASALAFWVLDTLCGGDATAVPYERCYRLTTAAATCQWISAFSLAFYFATLVLDLWPAARHASLVQPVLRTDPFAVQGLARKYPKPGYNLPRGRTVEDPQGWEERASNGGGVGTMPPPALSALTRQGQENDDLLLELGRARGHGKKSRVGRRR